MVALGHAHADAPPPLDQAIKQAAAAKKPLLIEFHAEWCKPCKEFEAKTLPDARVQAALEGVVFVRYDSDEAPGTQAAKKLEVSSYPTFVVLDTKGVELFRESGAPLGERGIKGFIEFIGKAREAALDEATVRASIKAKPNDPTALLAAARWFRSHDLVDDAIPAYEKVSTHKDATAAQRFDATAELVQLRRREVWRQQLLAEKIALIRAHPASARDDDLVIATVRSGLPMESVRALWKTVLDAEHDVSRLNSLVYIALAADASQEALEAAKRLVERRRTAQFLDTLAECYHVRGDRKMAMHVADEAVALANYRPEAPTIRENRTRFDKGGADDAGVRQFRLRAADLWKRIERIDQLAESVRDPDAASPYAQRERERQEKLVAQMRAEHALANVVAAACINVATDNDEALARIEIDEDGVIKSTVLLLEPTATKALRDCLTRELVGAKLDLDPMRPKSRIVINFRRTH
jgi:thiol-disulfide isomerase/thioredoxin